MEFRDKIKEICKERGLTQKELAAKIGVTDISLSKTLRGRYPQLQSLERIAKALNVPLSRLFEEEEGIRGFIKFEGIFYEIKSKEDLARLAKIVNIGQSKTKG